MEVITEWGGVLIALAVVFGLYMSWGIGANDVANSWGAAVGSGSISVKQAVLIAAVLEFFGAIIAGGNVTETIRGEILAPSAVLGNADTLVLGMLASLLAAALWLMIATSKGWPVSTTHSIVGAIVGFAVVAIGIEAVNWGGVSAIVASWVVSPLLGGMIAYGLMVSIRKLILEAPDPLDKAKTWGPVYIFLVGWLVSLITLFKGLQHLELDLSLRDSLLMATAIGLAMAFVGKLIIGRIYRNSRVRKRLQFENVEKVFIPPMVFAACAMAFAHGSNDVANGVGPLAAVVSTVNSGGVIGLNSNLPVWLLVVGGAGIALGVVTMGYRVMKTLGRRITVLTPTRGYCATLATVTTVVLASKTGLPVSTTHVAVGAVTGVGLARGMGALDLRVISDIIVAWLITLPAGGFLAACLYFVFAAVFAG